MRLWLPAPETSCATKTTTVLDTLLRTAITLSQKTPLRGRGGYSSLPLERQARASAVDKSIAEAADHQRFFTNFPGQDVAASLAGRDVLDFGSGYGGRTVEYARRLGARRVCGIEPVEAHITAGRELAALWKVDNVDFQVCSQDTIPYDSDSFDAVTTFDVLEHVRDPAVSLAELRRVLRTGGKLYAVFPLYRGMFAHHLDYITLLPALHLVFSPQRIMRVVNELLDGPMAHIQVDRHRTTPVSYAGKDVLPMLNGMGRRDFFAALGGGWQVDFMRQNSVFDAALGREHLLSRLMRPLMSLPPVVSEVFTFNVSCILTKR